MVVCVFGVGMDYDVKGCIGNLVYDVSDCFGVESFGCWCWSDF